MKSFHTLKNNYIIWLLVSVNLIFSQTTDSNEILEDYIHAGLENNPSLKQAFKQWKSAEAKVGFAKGLPNPTISFGYFLESVETAAGPQETKIGIMQKIPWFGKRKSKWGCSNGQCRNGFFQIGEKNDWLLLMRYETFGMIIII